MERIIKLYCSKCGKEINDNSKFCYLCGSEIKAENVMKNENVKKVKPIVSEPIKINNGNNKKKRRYIIPIVFIIISIFSIVGIVYYYPNYSVSVLAGQNTEQNDGISMEKYDVPVNLKSYSLNTVGGLVSVNNPEAGSNSPTVSFNGKVVYTDNLDTWKIIVERIFKYNDKTVILFSLVTGGNACASNYKFLVVKSDKTYKMSKTVGNCSDVLDDIKYDSKKIVITLPDSSNSKHVITYTNKNNLVNEKIIYLKDNNFLTEEDLEGLYEIYKTYENLNDCSDVPHMPMVASRAFLYYENNKDFDKDGFIKIGKELCNDGDMVDYEGFKIYISKVRQYE